ncbi:hypothetical protein C7S15_5149 [Burkholderia cepacia]|nr:hypothetical protein [Burkholderia cepacia]
MDFSYTIQDHAGTIVALADHLALSSLNLFGHSMGGRSGDRRIDAAR